ncbi:MAG: replication protein [Methylococcaceae bacterium]
MVNPQVEDGHIRIANEVWNALTKIRVPGEAMQVFFYIVRKTWGWGKKKDDIALSQFVLATGLKKPSVIRARNKLVKMNLITVYQKVNSTTATYSINKDFDRWKPLTKKQIVYQKVNKHLPKGKKSFTKKLPTITKKDTLTKDTKTYTSIQAIFDFYKLTFGKTDRYEFDIVRQGKLTKAITPKSTKGWGYTEEECKEAIRKLGTSKYHTDNGYTSLEGFIFKNSRKLEEWLNKPEATIESSNKEWFRKTGQKNSKPSDYPDSHPPPEPEAPPLKSKCPEAEEIWSEALAKIKFEQLIFSMADPVITKKEALESFDTWFAPAVGFDLKPDGTLIIATRNPMAGAWLTDHYTELINDVLEGRGWAFEVVG